MTKTKTLVLLILIASVCLLMPTSPTVSAQAVYGDGTYGSDIYSADSASDSSDGSSQTITEPTPTDLSAVESVILTVKANGKEITPDIELVLGEPIVFSGIALPYAEVHLYFHSTPFEAVVNADKDGHWSYTLTKDLGEGDHTLQIAIVNPETKMLSPKSTPKPFTLTAKATTVKNDVPTVAKATDYFWLYVFIALTICITLVATVSIMNKRRNNRK